MHWFSSLESPGVMWVWHLVWVSSTKMSTEKPELYLYVLLTQFRPKAIPAWLQHCCQQTSHAVHTHHEREGITVSAFQGSILRFTTISAGWICHISLNKTLCQVVLCVIYPESIKTFSRCIWATRGKGGR
jgi:hypothetical protein